MYQNVCKKCGSIALHTEVKGSNTGLYCSDCGAWIKWLGKDELRAFDHSNKMHGFTKEESESYSNAMDKLYKPLGVNFDSNFNIIDEIKDFVAYLDEKIDDELGRKSSSPEAVVIKCHIAQAYEKDKNALINILNGRHWNENIL